ncbi:uncharacterized protein LOC124466997 isoform X2 [Hypomesus transpacificus]|uniref:uncharacterized protein LOC124466997 isoform X2 n=1 Tax=Hypomesus transpacificus TaxID=137520 RepID=UPI001F086257|nr:uncharacterized protein LOC124466997 isoform X2 [Hypomesus transpacificus]
MVMTLAERAEEYRQVNDSFRHNAFKFIELMLTSGCHEIYVNEILHSIFFLGHILHLEAFHTLQTNVPEFTPEGILGEMYEEVQELFREPFDCYQTQLPKRTPFSCVLDMVVHRCGEHNEQQIVRQLSELVQGLELRERYKLTSSTICVSKYGRYTYYGASMSTEGRTAGRIMIAVSCLHTWHKSVSDAVMSYFPGKQKRNDFDGTLQLPDYVHCQAYSLRDREGIPPCFSCSNLFGLTTTDKRQFVYGNCAEAESVSRLLSDEQEVAYVIARQVEASPLYNSGKREHVARQVKRYLEDVKFPNVPQGVHILNDFMHAGDFVYYNPNW